MFWTAAALLLVACVLVIAAALRAVPADREAPDVAVYRDQLRELERDAARGTLAPEEAEAARTEVARRLLAADRSGGVAAKGPGNSVLGFALIAVPVIGIAVATYLSIGAPGYPDLPLATRIAVVEENRAARPGQEVAEAEVPDRIDDSRPDLTRMAEQLRAVLAERPDDLRGWRLAVQTEAGLGDLEAAWRAQVRVIEILGDDATSEDHAVLAELMIRAAGGYVSPEAERALSRALRADAGNGMARFYAGSMYAQGGRPDLAFTIWRRLIADSRPGDPWLEPIYGQIEEISQLAGDPTPLDQLPRPRGPSQADIDASGEMTLEDRMAMIEGMVEGLALRLADQGGPVTDWARLITAYGVLGRTDAAAAVYGEAKLVFAEDQSALDRLAQAADQAGLTP
ncbi:c-type cytochrome biogenesis protein CcmI [Jannaschia ovalis]|uniref:C-type cytochrome biogenesis protein CcmI n=1 Tax=Jannaschia ovalis TaxID=3038773 RepID=A0ABY8LE24_9RHOB|nr:c-type cytochrome biogenesis protein CcmI [Jannaschia sp. GRR-S6-38]WGH78648.1 c-type cytochrome biogenesis protein CcmI [Jannaschia sp. GRR-S6-38]